MTLERNLENNNSRIEQTRSGSHDNLLSRAFNNGSNGDTNNIASNDRSDPYYYFDNFLRSMVSNLGWRVNNNQQYDVSIDKGYIIVDPATNDSGEYTVHLREVSSGGRDTLTSEINASNIEGETSRQYVPNRPVQNGTRPHVADIFGLTSNSSNTTKNVASDPFVKVQPNRLEENRGESSRSPALQGRDLQNLANGGVINRRRGRVLADENAGREDPITYEEDEYLRNGTLPPYSPKDPVLGTLPRLPDQEDS